MLWRRTQPRTARIAALGVALLLLWTPLVTAAPAAWAPAGDPWTALWAWLGQAWPGGGGARAGWGFRKKGVISDPNGAPQNAGEPAGRDGWGIDPDGGQQAGGRCTGQGCEKAGIIIDPDGSPQNAGEPTGQAGWGIDPDGG